MAAVDTVFCARCKGSVAREDAVKKSTHTYVHKDCHSLQVYVARLTWPQDLAFEGAEKEEFFSKASRCRDPTTGKVCLNKLRNEVTRILTTRRIQQMKDSTVSPFRPLDYWKTMGFDTEKIRANCPFEEHPQGLGRCYQVSLHSEESNNICEQMAQESMRIELKARKRTLPAAPVPRALKDKATDDVEEADKDAAAEVLADLEEALADLTEDEEEVQEARNRSKAEAKDKKKQAAKDKKEAAKAKKKQEQEERKRQNELFNLASKANRFLAQPLVKVTKARDLVAKDKTASELVRESICSAHTQMQEWQTAALQTVLKRAKTPDAKLQDLPFTNFKELQQQVQEHLTLAATVKPLAKAKAKTRAGGRKRPREEKDAKDGEEESDKEESKEKDDDSVKCETAEETQVTDAASADS